MLYDHIIVGLGNPGPRYSFTRHNAGFLCLDLWAQEHRIKFQTPEKKGLASKTQSEVGEFIFKDHKVLLMKPQTFMNLSGESLRALFQESQQHSKTPLTVVHDELDVALGKVRIKQGGSDAGHNGLASIRAHLGHGDFNRVRIGIGRPEPESKIDIAAWVLKGFEKNEEPLLLDSLTKACEILENLVINPHDLKTAQVIASQEKRKTS